MINEEKMLLDQKRLSSLDVIEEDDYSPIKYKKGQLLGTGAYGRVYQAINESNGKLLAVKTIMVNLYIK